MSLNFDHNQLDISFGRFLSRCSADHSDLLFKAGRAVSQARREGNVCVTWRDIELSLDDVKVQKMLMASAVVGQAGEYCPLILHGDFLYLHRYFKYETVVADYIHALPVQTELPAVVHDLLNQLFPEQGHDVDEQKQAALASLVHSFVVISGGPGTGKTTTVAKILALHVALNPDLRIRLAAPTGKAASRMEDSLATTLADLDLALADKEKVAQPVQTIHRLLGFSPKGFLHNAASLLPADLVLIDEASMVDLSLMADLMQALPSSCRFILLGDQYQLASVQPGAVFGEICAGSKNYNVSPLSLVKGHPDSHSLSDCIVTLHKNYRFKKESGIRILGDFVKNGDGKGALQVLLDDQYPDVTLLLPDLSWLVAGIRKIHGGKEPEQVLENFNRLGVLCCHRTGVLGVEDVNRQVIRSYQQSEQGYFHGMPLMILANEYTLNVYNGDICVVVEKNKRLYGFFQTAGSGRMILLRKLPVHVPAYAITVHKSQGSEYTDVVFLLPAGASKVLGRELVYTAITRARKNVTVCGTSEQFLNAVSKKVVRISGLAGRIG